MSPLFGTTGNPGTSGLATALLAELDDAALVELAERLKPFLTARESPEADGWLRGADQIAKHIVAPPSRVYALSSAGRIPVERDGSALVARRSDLDRWLAAGGGKRP